jgi:flagellar biogenesis protein FliO
VDPLGTRRSVVAIDVNRHPMLYTVIRNRIGARNTLYSDLNDNHLLDPNEETAVIGLGLQDLN